MQKQVIFSEILKSRTLAIALSALLLNLSPCQVKAQTAPQPASVQPVTAQALKETAKPQATAPTPAAQPVTAKFQSPENGKASIVLSNGMALELMVVPGGTYLMGSPNQAPPEDEEEETAAGPLTQEASAPGTGQTTIVEDDSSEPSDSSEEDTQETALSANLPSATQDDEDSEEDEVAHPVTITGSLLVGVTEVTQGMYTAVMGSNPSGFRWSGTDYPVEQVSWFDAVIFCNRLSRLTGLQACYDEKTYKCDFNCDGFRLPTEAEWEFFARAGNPERFSFGHDSSLLPQYAIVAASNLKGPARVGSAKANQWGLQDIHGNVWEWCYDVYAYDYDLDSRENPVNHGRPLTIWELPMLSQTQQIVTAAQEGPETSGGNDEDEDEILTRVIRGGGWGSVYYDCRSANRGKADPLGNYNDVGFRIVKIQH